MEIHIVFNVIIEAGRVAAAAAAERPGVVRSFEVAGVRRRCVICWARPCTCVIHVFITLSRLIIVFVTLSDVKLRSFAG